MTALLFSCTALAVCAAGSVYVVRSRRRAERPCQPRPAFVPGPRVRRPDLERRLDAATVYGPAVRDRIRPVSDVGSDHEGWTQE